MDINSEKIILTLPESELPAEAKPQDKWAILRHCTFVFSLLLIMLSLTIHIGIVAAFCDFAAEGDDFGEMLLSAVLPSFTKKEAFSEAEKTEIHRDVLTTVTDKAETSAEPSDNNETTKNSISTDLSAAGEHGFSLKNETSYNPDLDVLYNSPNPIDKADKLYEKYTEGEPLVLIYHTHGTESYNDTNDTGTYRSSDPEKNMISIGEVLADALEENGIGVIHLTELFDADSYNTAYDKSSSAVKKVTDEHPSIQYILDIHRDSITDENGNCLSADFTYNGLTAAQLMFVVGTDEGGSGHTEWRQNLTAVLHLQDMLYNTASSSVRPINLRKASFYQDKSAGAMLVEIGTSGNTLAEAKRSAVIFAYNLAQYITGREPAVSEEEMLGNIA